MLASAASPPATSPPAIPAPAREVATATPAHTGFQGEQAGIDRVGHGHMATLLRAGHFTATRHQPALAAVKRGRALLVLRLGGWPRVATVIWSRSGEYHDS